MAIQFNPEDISAWQFRLSISKIAESTPTCSRTFIKPFKLNTLFTSSVVAVGVLVDNAKEHWQDGGEVAQDSSFLNSDSRYFDTGISFYSVKKLLINRVTVIELPLVTDAYSLVYFPNPYFQSITVEVWEYTGNVVDTIEQQLTSLENQLTEIENNVLEPVNASLVNTETGLDDILSSLAAISTILSNLSTGIPIEPPVEPPVEPPIEPEPITTIEAETREVTEEFYTVVTSNLWLLN